MTTASVWPAPSRPWGCDACGDGYTGVSPVCGLVGDGVDEALGLRARLRQAVETGLTPAAHVRRWLRGD